MSDSLIDLRFLDGNGIYHFGVYSQETFEELAVRWLQTQIDKGAPNLSIDDVPIITVKFNSYFRQRPPLYPHKNERVLATVTREELQWPGSVTLSVERTVWNNIGMYEYLPGRYVDAQELRAFSTSLRSTRYRHHNTEYSVANGSSYGADSVFQSTVLATVTGDADGSTNEKKTGRRSSNYRKPVISFIPRPSINLIENIFFEILDRSAMHGFLERMIDSTDSSHTWEEAFFILDGHKLWFTQPTAATSRTHNQIVNLELSCLQLPSSSQPIEYVEKTGTANLLNMNKVSFSVTLAHDPLKRNTDIVLRAEDKMVAEDWVAAFHGRSYHSGVNTENKSFIDSEEFISKRQNEVSSAEFASVSIFNTFEGMLKSKSLREHFFHFLQSNANEESFQFWERAEDFRRGSLNSTHPFPYNGDSRSTPKAHLLWARHIFDSFLKDGAPYQISECSGDDVETVLKSLEECEKTESYPPENLFASVQSKTYHKMKYSGGNYLAFVQLPNYRRMLMTALHEQQRYNRGYEYVSTCTSKKDQIGLSSFNFLVTKDNKGKETGTEKVVKMPSIAGSMKNLFNFTKRSSPSEEKDGDVTIKDDKIKATVEEKLQSTRNTWWRYDHNLKQIKRLPFWWWDFIYIDRKRLDEEKEILFQTAFTIDIEKATRLPMKPLARHLSISEQKYLFQIHAIKQSNYFTSLQSSVTGTYGEVVCAGMLKTRNDNFLAEISRDPTVNESVLSTISSTIVSTLYGDQKWREVYAIVTTFHEKGRLLLFDSNTMHPLVRVRLELITAVTVSAEDFYGIELYEGKTSMVKRWQFAPVTGSDYTEMGSTTYKWVETLAKYGSPDCVSTNIIFQGSMQKRGGNHTSSGYRTRWFILTTFRQLQYYSIQRGEGSFKGAIDLKLSSGIERNDGTCEINIRMPGRIFNLRAENEEEAMVWMSKLRASAR